jgi:hypothetical protein
VSRTDFDPRPVQLEGIARQDFNADAAWLARRVLRAYLDERQGNGVREQR